MYVIYRTLSLLLGPIIDWHLRRRLKKGKEDVERFEERLGIASKKRPEGKLIWFHAASVGEILSVLPLLNLLANKLPTIKFLVTTGTTTSAAILAQRNPERTTHQYVPVDKIRTVNRFLDHWKPDLALFVESELWPNLVVETHRRKIPMVQVNARMSPKSYDTWKRHASLIKKMLSCFSLSLAQSEEDAARLQALGAPDAKYVGNLKFDAPPLPADPKELSMMLKAFGDRPVWMAASTHEGEESVCIDLHKELKQHFPHLLTVIVPRHPERGESVAHLAAGLSVKRRSVDKFPDAGTDVFIVDKIGELGIYYRLIGLVFMGGSLVPHGGQNPLEPARFESTIMMGPHTANFEAVYQALEQEDAAVRVLSSEDLRIEIIDLLNDSDRRLKMAEQAGRFVQREAGALQRISDELIPVILPILEERH